MGLRHVFGDKPQFRIIDFFRVHQYWDYSLKDLAKEAQVSHRTCVEIVKQLKKSGILVQTRTEGKAKMYKYSNSPLAKEINRFAIEMDIASHMKTEKQEHTNTVCQECGQIVA